MERDRMPLRESRKPAGARLIFRLAPSRAGPSSTKPTLQPVIGTYCYQLGYFPMISPVNLTIYALGGFMLFALAIGFFATPV